jgi:hypothetical protein
MEITAAMVKELRSQSGAGIMECKSALKETKGDVEDAITFLRKKGLAKADKKADRQTTEGKIGSYIHQGSKIGVLLALHCETDFVANTLDFATLMNVGANFSFRGLAVGLFICLCQSFFPKECDRVFHIAFSFFQGRFALHDSCARLGAQFFHHRSSYFHSISLIFKLFVKIEFIAIGSSNSRLRPPMELP